MRPVETRVIGSAARTVRAQLTPERRRDAAAGQGSLLGNDSADAIIESLADRIVVVNGDGVITTTNAAWNVFARAQSHTFAPPIGIGANYFDFCRALLDGGCQEMG